MRWLHVSGINPSTPEIQTPEKVIMDGQDLILPFLLHIFYHSPTLPMLQHIEFPVS